MVEARFVQAVTVSQVKAVLVEEEDGMNVGEEANVGVGVAVRKCALEGVGMEEEAYKTKKEEEEVVVELGLAGVQVAN